MKLSEMKQTLAERELRLTKSLGQNFLHDQNQLRRIVAAAKLTAGEKVLEIGPGLGPLTTLLIESGANMVAIEKDRRLYDFLQEKFPASPNFTLLHDDALSYVKQNRQWAGWKLVSNLPYSVASPILVELALAEEPPERIVTTLQLEVAWRLMAETDADDYGVLSLLMRLRFEPEECFKIPASCFFPEPSVDSACIVLVRRREPLLKPALQPAFVKIVKRGFSQRRKMMLKLLKQDWPKTAIESAFAKIGLSLQIRAEKVSLEQFAKLTEILTSYE
jgi:16S rRNA (adenine1518-N6/adenine1519-N6)-dimethyltransferase